MRQITKREQSRPVVLDLFCGAGGMSLGFHMAGYEIGLGVDVDPPACQTHAHNFKGWSAQADIAKITDPQSFIQQHGLESVDVIVGGPLCQGFSRVGHGKLRLYNDPHYVHDPCNQLAQPGNSTTAIVRQPP
ncbi:MAG: DNA cytosine methyltransferase [Chloroflexi bacterium]|nr:DNA cytosine methyltransferase [Chloroflexota bacterium]MCL5074275.1 DNA cytosine methyltransferase [Chloroflexota bacterium]